METIILFLVVAASFVFVAMPYFQKRIAVSASAKPTNGRLAALDTQRDNIFAAIKDLEFDHEMGKIADADYAQMNRQLRRQAATVLQAIDGATNRLTMRENLESELQVLRQQRGGEQNAFCTNCGAAMQSQDRFCRGCGKRIHP